MRQFASIFTLTVLLCLPGISNADGLIYQLSEDGAWVRFEIKGEGINSDSTVSVTVDGTQTLRSVGKKMVDNQPCRWIELESQLMFTRTGGQTQKFTEIIKLLIPEKALAKGKDPRDHVLKAYKGASADKLQELNLKGAGAREIQSMDEFFHAPFPLKETTKLPAAAIKINKKNWECEGVRGESKSDKVIFRTETRFHKQAPFGIVTYKYEKERRGNGKFQGMRTMEWKLVESGKDAKSAAAKAD